VRAVTCILRTHVDDGGRYKMGDEMRSLNAANAEDRDYEKRLLKVGTARKRAPYWAERLLLFALYATCSLVVTLRWRCLLSRPRRRSDSLSRCSFGQRCSDVHASLPSLTTLSSFRPLQRDKSREEAAIGKILKHKVLRRVCVWAVCGLCVTPPLQVDRLIEEKREAVNYESEADKRAGNVRMQRQAYMDRIMAQRPHPCLDKQMIINFHKPRDAASSYVI
jgi:hypothetical protein